MKIFDMIRINDESGISGTGKVLTGVVFDDGSCVVRWCTETHTTEFCDSFEDFKKIHIGYHPTNKTELHWRNVDSLGTTIEKMNVDNENMFVKFVENNDNEGETWYFFLQAQGNKKALEELQDYISENDLEDTYQIDSRLIPERDVDTLVKYGDEGYMNTYNKVVGLLDFSKLPIIDEDKDDREDPLYKGGIKDFIKK